uniref:Uncharacterized protein n=1 Tax=Trichobilharzia regenti TaxID=157069 RepID=A0AA85J6P9_TRIRE|nr:unnamed protein product [Trichobilharzia regenti]
MIPWRLIRSALLLFLSVLLLIQFLRYMGHYFSNDKPYKVVSNFRPPPNHFNLPENNQPDYWKLPLNENIQVSYRVHGFYYAWYDAPKISSNNKHYSTNDIMNNNNWTHWNHPRLRHWNAKVAIGYSTEPHYPPYLIASSFYPKLGPYSSKSQSIIHSHMKMVKFAGIGVLVVSWYPPGMADDNGKPVDDLILPLLNIANKYAIKICLHLEPYAKRDISTIVRDLKYIHTKGYTSHPAYYRVLVESDTNPSVTLPVVYVYDSYRIKPSQWKQILQPGEEATNDCKSLSESGFNGGYTYFVGHKISEASSPDVWSNLKQQCSEYKVGFYPSVGPGYHDLSVRPWNGAASKERESGDTYVRVFNQALNSQPDGIGIVSFNEWHEGTQIEPAKPFKWSGYLTESRVYMDYTPYSPEFYLRLTRLLVNKYEHYTNLPAYYRQTNESELQELDSLITNEGYVQQNLP